ncbi:MarR family transcriptional regulator [Streptomyces sp. cmx-18-6]|uniref:MarR family transcriptional regulator n=1 Tax=Streptomyces sp. cmx-18-6 TaxID=2790930 RepID=UPI00397EC72A
MATQHPSPAPLTPARSTAYPMAKPGYGKRSAPSQLPRASHDFALLPTRERYVAGFVDHLPEGAAMSVKQLAKQLPLYGQQAISTALTALSVAGHLRRVRCAIGVGGETRWAFRTFWSRTARDNEWWNAFLAAENAAGAGVGSSPPDASGPGAALPPPWVPNPESPPAPPENPRTEQGPEPTPVPHQRSQAHTQVPAPDAALTPPAPETPPPPIPDAAPKPPAPASHAVPAPPEPGTAPAPPPDPAPKHPAPAPAAPPSPAYLALARLGRQDHRLALSAADCAVLEAQAAEWLVRGVSADYLTAALTAGLPAHVDSPVGFLRRRLTDKIPPLLPAEGPPSGGPARRVLLECTGCGTPGRPEALPDGLCRPCRDAHRPEASEAPVFPAEGPDVRAHMSNLRELLTSV